MVALGIMAAVLVANYLAKKYLLSPQVILDLAIWILISAFVFARLFHVLFYDPSYYLTNPMEILYLWHGGASSLGGFFGAAVAVFLFAKVRKFSWKELLPYFDVGALSLWLGWGIGRIGCFLIHDHPGTLSHFFLAVQYPALPLDNNGMVVFNPSTDAVFPRHDLGLYESILGFVLFIVFALLFKKLVKKRWGLVALWSSVSYVVVRFFLDFLRATDLQQVDARYASLTPAQWGMIAIVLGLTSLFIYGKMKRQNTVDND